MTKQPMHRLLHNTLLLLAVATLGLASGPVRAQEEASESQLKAAFLYKFTHYIEWPADSFANADAPLIIGVADSVEVAQALSKLIVGRRLRQHPVQLRTLDDAATSGPYHVLFIGHSYSGSERLLASLRDSPTLTVCENEHALSRGCAINFVVVDDRMRFQVSLPNAHRNKLKISSQLLGVAQRVIREAP